MCEVNEEEYNNSFIESSALITCLGFLTAFALYQKIVLKTLLQIMFRMLEKRTYLYLISNIFPFAFLRNLLQNPKKALSKKEFL